MFLTSTRSQLLRKAASHPTESDKTHQDEESSRQEQRCERRQDVEEAIGDHVHCEREGVDATTTVVCNTEPPFDEKGTNKKAVTFSDNVRIEVYSFEAPSCSTDDDDDEYDDELSEYSEATFDDCNVFDLIFCVACV